MFVFFFFFLSSLFFLFFLFFSSLLLIHNCHCLACNNNSGYLQRLFFPPTLTTITNTLTQVQREGAGARNPSSSCRELCPTCHRFSHTHARPARPRPPDGPRRRPPPPTLGKAAGLRDMPGHARQLATSSPPTRHRLAGPAPAPTAAAPPAPAPRARARHRGRLQPRCAAPGPAGSSRPAVTPAPAERREPLPRVGGRLRGLRRSPVSRRAWGRAPWAGCGAPRAGRAAFRGQEAPRARGTVRGGRDTRGSPAGHAWLPGRARGAAWSGARRGQRGGSHPAGPAPPPPIGRAG